MLDYLAPEATLMTGADSVDDDWAIAGVVAAILGLGTGYVFYICSVCGARSIWQCIDAVQKYHTRAGC